MSRFLCVLLTLIAGAARAADTPNSLTPKATTDGWILLFDGDTTFGWRIDGKGSVEKGALILGGDERTVATITTAFANCELRFEHQLSGTPAAVKDAPPASFRWGGNAAQQRSLQGTNPKDQQDKWGSCELKIRDWRTDITLTNVDGKMFASTTGAFFGSKGSNLSDKPIPVTAQFTFTVPKGQTLRLRNVRLQPTGTKPLFNGKDLSGWKLFTGDKKREKSDFSVTKDGELAIKNGPGDLATTGHHDNFVLQLECKTNGAGLNSGVFFRCRPDEYQNGYEAQIHNDWSATGKKYSVDQFDPTTNEPLKEKRIVVSDAKDFGTGAIYRRIPARRGLAKDQEWFTMTVVANGRHIATWVNGVQVVDWTDHRKPNDNARNGYRQDKGPISLQGHDPTTDLLFRNIRLAELPPTAKKAE